MSLVKAYIGFGANLGDPVQQILDARRQLRDRADVTGLVNSSLYLTSPVGYQNQSQFVNCVSSIETSLSAHSLLEVLQKIENQLGRQRDSNNQNAARLIDLDILLYGTQHVNDKQLVLPHPRLEERLFTLEPLCEISPKLSWNDTGNVSQILEQGYAVGRFVDQKIHRLT